MRLPEILRHGRLLACAELLIAEIRVRALARRYLLLMVASVIALIGLAFANLAMFRWLEMLWGPLWAPLVVGLFNFVLAAIVIGAALASKSSRELQTAEQLRDAIASQLEDAVKSGEGHHGLLSSAVNWSAAPVLLMVLKFVISLLRAKPKRPAE